MFDSTNRPRLTRRLLTGMAFILLGANALSTAALGGTRVLDDADVSQTPLRLSDALDASYSTTRNPFQHWMDDGNTDEIFQSAPSAAGSSPAAKGTLSEDLLKDADLPTARLPDPLIASDSREDFYDSNPFFRDAFVAAETNSASAQHASGLPFWESTSSADNGVDYADIHVEFAAANATPNNVLIPLPPAAWSAISIMGGAGLMQGVRKLRGRRN